jgi:Zn-dependent protease
MPDLGQIAYMTSIWALPVLLAITFHEAAHAYAAWLLGDDFAHHNGRTSLNPLKHIDPFGTIFLPALLIVTGAGFIIGYAKPVPVFFQNLRPQRLGTALVAAAGPAANIVLALMAAILMHIADLMPEPISPWLLANLKNALIINALLAAFNLLPVPPLDGGRILLAVLPREIAIKFAPFERVGIFIVLGLALIVPMLAGEFGYAFNPIADWAQGGAEIILDIVLTITGWR